MCHARVQQLAPQQSSADLLLQIVLIVLHTVWANSSGSTMSGDQIRWQIRGLKTDDGAVPSLGYKSSMTPFYADPVFDAAHDPELVWHAQEQTWWVLYLQVCERLSVCNLQPFSLSLSLSLSSLLCLLARLRKSTLQIVVN